MSFIIRNLTAGAVAVNDLGFEISAGADYDMLDEAPNDVQASGQVGGDLNTEISAGNLIVLNPKDGLTQLTTTNSIAVIQLHNDPNWGINGAVLNDLDNVNTTGSVIGDVLQLDGTGGFSVVQPSVLAGGIALGNLSDVTDITGHVLGEFYILEGDGAGGHTLVSGATDTSLFIPFVENTTGTVVSGGIQTDITLTYNTNTNKVDAAIVDNFLRNTGDTLTAGSLNIASGAAIVVSTGGTLTIVDAPTIGTDGANKAYVDSVAQGADIKDSVQVATTPIGGDIGGTYSGTGGTGGTGNIVGITSDVVDGVTVVVGNRLIIKNQVDAKQNGIYVVVSIATAPIAMTVERAPDQDGSPVNNVSAGNLAFVETGTINANTSWVVSGTGILTLNTDPINWTQFSGAGSFTAGPGLGLNCTQFSLVINNLTSITTTLLDEVAFNDVTDLTTKKRTFGSVIADLGIFTTSTLTASDGVLISAGDIQLDITNLPVATNPTLLAEMVFDAGGTGTHNKSTVGDFFNGLDVPHGITTNGIITRTANDVYAQRTVIADVTAGKEGVLVTDGDGVLGNITIGADIVGQTASLSILSSTTEVLGYDGINNVKFTGLQIANGILAILGGLGNAYTTIQGDTGSALAGSTADTLAFLGATNGGITTIATDSAPDTVTFALDIPKLAVGAGTVVLTDEIAIGEGTNTVKYTLQSIVTDLGIPSGIGALTGLVVGDGLGNFISRSVIVDGIGALDGLAILNGSGVAANPTIGLDINGSPVAGENIAAIDTLIGYNASATANQTFTGQEVADGVSTMLGFGGLVVTTINGQEVLTLVDTTRANKILSVETTAIMWSENRIGNNDWIQIGSAVDSKTGYVVPMNATITKVTAHTADNKGHTKNLNLYINGINNGALVAFTGLAGEDMYSNILENIDVNQGDKLRLRGATGGRIEDTVITIWLKWRG